MALKLNTWRALAVLMMLIGVTALRAQSPHELGHQDKIELYLQYLGRVIQVEPEVFSALLLEFEALPELWSLRCLVPRVCRAP